MNVAVSPVASISPQAANAGVTPTAEGQTATPFAAVLQEQMTDPGATGQNEASAPDAAAQVALLFGANELAEWIAANMAQGSATKAAHDDDEPTSATSALMLGMLTVPAAVMTHPAVNSATVATPGTKVASDVASLIDARLATLSAEGKGETGAASGASLPAMRNAGQPGGFPALPDTMIKAAKGAVPTPVPATSSPAIVAATEDTIAIAIQSDAKSLAHAESLSSPNREPIMATTAAATTALPQLAPSTNEAGATPRIATPVGAAGWDTEVGNRVAWMASHQQGRADLVLTPPQLGRIEISLSVNGDQANAFFVSANPAVRETLEGALPRLREILADAGITLGQAQVGSESPGQSANKHENGDNSPRGPNAGFIGDPAATRAVANAVAPWSTAGRGMVDIFA
jgi:flagellar hook-length control protein FliK